MATAAEQQSIIQLVVGMVNAAPGADILAELEELIDLGMTIEEVAIAITANPAWSGDTGLFPDYLPNAVFAENFLTQLIGSEVTEDYLEEAVAEMTASLNAGDSRGAAINDAIDALAATDSADDDLGDAATALANKTEVATYYSVELGVSSDDLDVLKSIVEDVTSDEDAVEDGEAAADAIIADLQPLQLLINNLDDANTAVETFLAAADGDGSAKTSLTEAEVDPGLLTAADIDVAAALMGAGAGGYAAGSDAVKDALIADDLVSNAIASGVQAKALADSLKAADAVTGLTAAHSIYLASLASKESADDAASIAAANLVAEIASYDVTDEDVTNNFNVSFTTVGDGEIIGLNATSTSLEIKPGFDEDSNPGITALFTAALINLGAVLGATAAGDAVTAAMNNVANLDVLAASAREGALEDMSDAMILRDVVVPALTDGPTVLEIALEQDGLEALLEVLEDALDDVELNPLLVGGVDDSDADVLGQVEAALDAAEAAGTITTAHNAAALLAFGDDGVDNDDFATQADVTAAISLVKASLATDSLSAEFDALVTIYEGTIAAGPDAQTPLTLDVLTELGNSETDADNNAALAEAIADRNTAKAAIDDLEALTDAVDDAEDAFGDAGFGVPVTLGAIASATSADDVFLANDADSQILGFAGDDQLFLGDVDLVLNADTTAGDEGDNDVLEYWITGTTSAVITVETSEFGSEAADPETFTITLTGVAAADVTVTDGMLTIAS